MKYKNKITDAVYILNEYRRELDNLTTEQQCAAWQIKVSDTVLNYIGNTQLYTTFQGFSFSEAIAVMKQSDINRRRYEGYEDRFNINRKITAVNLLDNIIDYIEKNGVLTGAKKTNFFGGFSNSVFFSGLIFYTFLFGGVLFTVGTMKTDRDYENLKDNYRELTAKDSILKRQFLELENENTSLKQSSDTKQSSIPSVATKPTK